MSATPPKARPSRPQTRPPSIGSHAKRPRTDDNNSEDMPNSKPRLRVTRACEECRKRKDRCDGRRPTCETCFRMGRKCSYNPSKKRGLRTGYVRAMEVVLGLVFSTIDGCEEWISSLLEGKETYPIFQLKGSTSLHTSHTADALADSWRNSSMVNQIEKLLIQPGSAEEDCEGNSTKVFDHRAALAIDIAARISRQKTPLASRGEDVYTQESPINTETTSAVVINSPSSHVLLETSALSCYDTHSSLSNTQSHLQESVSTSLDLNAESQPGADDSSQSLRGLLPSNWSALLDLYFTISHSWLPISPKHDLLRSSYVLASHNELNTLPRDLSKGDLSFLIAVLAYASLLGETFSGEDLNRDERLSTQSKEASLQERALSLLPSDPDGFELGHVRALMVLTLLQIHNGSSKGAWLTLGRAVYALTSLEIYPLRLKETNLGLQDGAKRTTLCCAVLDSLVASWVQARPYFQQSDMSTIGSIPTDSIDEWEPWKPPGTVIGYSKVQEPPGMVLSCFNHLVELAGLFNNLSSTSGQRPQENRVQFSKQNLQSLMQRLSFQHASAFTTDLLPQAKNLIMLAAIITAMIHSQDLIITGSRSGSDYFKSHNHLEQAIEKLRHYTSYGATYLLSPLYIIYSSILHRVLDSYLKSNSQLPQIRGELQLLGNSLSELDQLRRTMMKGNAHYLGDHSAVPILPTQSEGVSMDNVQDAPSQQSLPEAMAMEVLFNASSSIQSTEYRNYDINMSRTEQPSFSSLSTAQLGNRRLTHAADTPMPPISAENQERSQDTMISAQLFNPVPDEMDDDGLFQSLADLDSSDWSANPPEFMKHLGILGDTAVDIYTYFDPNPG